MKSKKEQALDLRTVRESLRHWREDYKNLKLFGGAADFGDVFVAGNCDCCLRHSRGYRAYESRFNCGRCPLDNYHYCCTDGCSPSTTPWRRALDAADSEDKSAFMRARRCIIDRLRRAERGE